MSSRDLTLGDVRRLGLRLRYTRGVGLTLEQACRRILGWSIVRGVR